MIRINVFQIIYLILNVHAYHINGDLIDSKIDINSYMSIEGMFDAVLNSTHNLGLALHTSGIKQSSLGPFKGNTQGNVYFQRRTNKLIPDILKDTFLGNKSTYQTYLKTKTNGRYKTNVLSKLNTISFDSLKNIVLKEINRSSLKGTNHTTGEAKVDIKRKELILYNETRLQTQSNNQLDELQAIKDDQQKSRKKITSLQGGIKGSPLNTNYSQNSKNNLNLNVSLVNRVKRNAKQAKTFDYVYDEIEINNLSEVYAYLHTVFKTLKNSVNFTMRSSEINMTSDAEKLCIGTFEAYYGNSNDDGEVYCNSSWDNFSCWPRTLAGTSATIPCPGYLDGIDENNNATKYCNENGTWALKAVYNLCVVADESFKMDDQMPHAMAIRVIYNVGFCISTLALIIALFIFLYFRSLRCLRNSIHCHLIVTFIITNIIWIIMRHSLIYMQDPVYSWCCKMLTSIFNFAHATNFFWMFVEGLYLHVIIVWTYSADKIKLRYLIFIGWGLPTTNIITWIIVRAVYDNDHCWFPHPEGNSVYDYVYIGPILFVLFANIIFLSTIVWVLITKLRASHSLETRQYRKAVKATIILFPLLGITYVLFIIPPSDHPKVQILFRYINAALQSFQGLMVAIFYCFLNGEVKGVLKKKISRYNDARSLSTKFTRASYGWSRGSRDFSNTTTLGNGALIDPNHRVTSNIKATNAETIPLTDSNETELKENDFV